MVTDTHQHYRGNYAKVDLSYSGPTVRATTCNPSVRTSRLSGDCNDSDPRRYPGNAEVCNATRGDGIDNDCDGAVDENNSRYYRDSDSDGRGNPSVSLVRCSAPGGYVSNANDCDDGNRSRYVGNSEVCDGIDNDCDSSVDEGHARHVWYRDRDNDGHADSGSTRTDCRALGDYRHRSVNMRSLNDCDDTNRNRFPGNTEVCGDGIDNNCVNGTSDEPL
jgi:hypothetical protein